ncbi:MAG TPA: hypothetical protein VMY06_13410 [Sedimentisphaerales bacterium]|nr:hypothetical protein [Sedimentisphaerales bacterium]
MALVKFGGGIVKLSGSLAGNTFARNRSGDYVRSWKNPVNPRSTRQEAIRAIVSFLAEYWHDVLTPTQRAEWEVYASSVSMLNKLGDSIYLTGFNMFIRTNSGILTMPETQIDDAPTILSLPEKDATLAVSAESIADQEFTFTCSTAGWAAGADDKLGILLYMGTPQLASRNFFAGPWRYMDYIDATEGAAGTGDYVAPFPFAVGQKIFFKARLMTVSGRFSQQWYPDPLVAEADA